MPTLNYKNIDIHYTSSGKGVAVTLLHGFLENLTMWNDIGSVISNNNRVICIDLLGHGKTGNIGYLHSMEMQSECVWHVLNHLKIEKSIFIGHSMGGYVALAVAESFPPIVQGLCLMNSSALADTNEKKINRDRAIAAVKHNPEIFVKMAIPNLFSEENRSKFPHEIEQLTKEALKISQQGVIAAMEGMKIRKDRSGLYHSLDIPFQLIIGKKDPALDYQSLKDQSKNTNVQVTEFPDGHMSHIENKEALIKSLIRFLLKCFPKQ